MLVLPKLPYNVAIVETTRYPSFELQSWDLTKTRAIEDAFNLLEATVGDLGDLVTALADVVAEQAAQLALIQAAQDAADAAQGEVDDMNDDNLLTPVEKPVWIKLYDDIIAEQSDIDTKATSYGITTQKTNYDNAITALTSHLATLMTPVAWNNLTGNTTIVGTTFRTKFKDVASTKQLLLNVMHNTARTSAASAQSTANTAASDASDALADAAAAQSDATDALSDAAAAQTTANTVKRDLAISTGYPAPGDVLSAADVGSDCTITIDAHTRVYGDIANLSVSGGTITGRSFSTTYYVYYDDTTRADTTPSYLSTTNPNVAVPQKAAGRHYVGSITTPADGGGDTTGGAAPPSGGGGIARTEVGGTFS
jgi:hypothetical protein